MYLAATASARRMSISVNRFTFLSSATYDILRFDAMRPRTRHSLRKNNPEAAKNKLSAKMFIFSVLQFTARYNNKLTRLCQVLKKAAGCIIGFVNF